MTWLQQQTGQTDREWIEYVQSMIVAHTHPSLDPNHDDTDVSLWIGEVTDKIMALPAAEPRDDNMWTARVLSAVLALWYHNVQFAKTRDPRRPIALRLQAQKRLGAWRVGMVKIAMERHEEIEHIFHGQEFEDPKSKHATDGIFI